MNPILGLIHAIEGWVYQAHICLVLALCHFLWVLLIECFCLKANLTHIRNSFCALSAFFCGFVKCVCVCFDARTLLQAHTRNARTHLCGYRIK